MRAAWQKATRLARKILFWVIAFGLLGLVISLGMLGV